MFYVVVGGGGDVIVVVVLLDKTQNCWIIVYKVYMMAYKGLSLL